MNPDVGTSNKFFQKRVYGDIIHISSDELGNYKNTVSDPYVTLFGEWSAFGKMMDLHLPLGTIQE